MRNETLKTVTNKFEEFIIEKDHPCLMAQGVVKQGNYVLYEYEEFGLEANVKPMIADISKYLEEYNFDKNDFYTLVAVFKGRSDFTEHEFEERLWQQLQLLHEADSEPWDTSVEDDPKSENFSFSLMGRAFYIVGMHPNSSRLARQAPYPILMFNLHQQFEKLREMGVYEQTRDKIRERDSALQGNVNPMLADFGHGHEAPQYSGRKVNEDWKCPFHFTSEKDQNS